jgi:hypothetical protein
LVFIAIPLDHRLIFFYLHTKTLSWLTLSAEDLLWPFRGITAQESKNLSGHNLLTKWGKSPYFIDGNFPMEKGTLAVLQHKG